MPYSLDLRKKVIEFVESGYSVSQTAKTFKIGKATIYRWLDRPNLAPIRVTTRKRKIDMRSLEQDVERDPDTPLKERAKRFGVTPAALCYRFKKMKITRKKTVTLSGKGF